MLFRALSAAATDVHGRAEFPQRLTDVYRVSDQLLRCFLRSLRWQFNLLRLCRLDAVREPKPWFPCAGFLRVRRDFLDLFVVFYARFAKVALRNLSHDWLES